MISEVTRTCATCPFARAIDGDRYLCTAPDSQVFNSETVVRGHWEAIADCDRAIEELQGQNAENADADYVMTLEASLEKSESRSVQVQQFSQIAPTYGIEVDSIKLDSYRIWSGLNQIGTMRRTAQGWLARTSDCEKSWHSTPNAAQNAVVNAMLAVAS